MKNPEIIAISVELLRSYGGRLSAGGALTPVPKRIGLKSDIQLSGVPVFFCRPKLLIDLN